MPLNNIVKIYNENDFKSFLKKHGNNNHVVISVMTYDTEKEIINMISSFMKKKASLYKKIYFIIYIVSNENINIVLNKFNICIENLPYISYIYNNKEKLVDVTVADNIKAIKESFNVMEEYYDETI